MQPVPKVLLALKVVLAQQALKVKRELLAHKVELAQQVLKV